MALRRIRRATALGAVTLAAVALMDCARADAIRVHMTVDNSYALFVGNYYGATTFVGSDFSWPTVETYNFDLGSDAYLYVVTASDRSTAQGFLGEFDNLATGYRFLSNDPQWQVAATGLGQNAPYTGSTANLALLSTEILDANAGNTISDGWTTFTAGGVNGSSPWGLMAGIDPSAQWVWYAGGNCSPTNPTLGGCDAGEWLMFRIAVAATPTDPVPPPPAAGVPEPSTIALLGVASLAAVAARRRTGGTPRAAGRRVGRSIAAMG